MPNHIKKNKSYTILQSTSFKSQVKILEKEMLIESKTEKGVLILTLQEKRLDAMLAVSFKNKFTESLSEGYRRIVINLSAVEFIDSSGLGALVSCLKLLGPDAKGNIALCHLSPEVASMFKFTRMDKLFSLFDTEEHAKQSL